MVGGWVRPSVADHAYFAISASMLVLAMTSFCPLVPYIAPIAPIGLPSTTIGTSLGRRNGRKARRIGRRSMAAVRAFDWKIEMEAHLA